jgi:hypothetical protein
MKAAKSKIFKIFFSDSKKSRKFLIELKNNNKLNDEPIVTTFGFFKKL